MEYTKEELLEALEQVKAASGLKQRAAQYENAAKLLSAVGDKLTERERIIFGLRYGVYLDEENNGLLNYKEVGKRFGITGERVMQITNKAKRKIRLAIDLRFDPDYAEERRERQRQKRQQEAEKAQLQEAIQEIKKYSLDFNQVMTLSGRGRDATKSFFKELEDSYSTDLVEVPQGNKKQKRVKVSPTLIAFIKPGLIHQIEYYEGRLEECKQALEAIERWELNDHLM